MIRSLTSILALVSLPLSAQEIDLTDAPCGGSFATFKSDLVAEAVTLGHDEAQATAFLAGIHLDPAVLEADRRQGVFQRDFIDFSRRLIANYRVDSGRYYAGQLDDLFDRIEAQYGVDRGVLIAFWAFETDFGQVQGDFNTVNALVTLAHDCRRPALFRPQVFAALELYEQGALNPATMQGAWAGEIGQVQMLPEDIIVNGRDGDGDGIVDLRGSSADALTSGASVLSSLGWRPGEPWLQEVRLPDDLDWASTGLGKTQTVAEWAAQGVVARNGNLAAPDTPASVLIPMGRKGPAFLAYPNFDVYFEWNKSFVYVLTAAYFANILEGEPRFEPGNPEPGLSGEQIIELQEKLSAMGYDVGGIDGIIGARTRAAVQAEQQRLGMPADAWPTPALLNAL